MRRKPTPAEQALHRILNEVGNGRLRGTYIRQWAFGGRWILDFYFPDRRLGIEVDGCTHWSAEQRRKDERKARACARRGITLIRVTNNEVLFGSRAFLLDKLRAAWTSAPGRRGAPFRFRSWRRCLSIALWRANEALATRKYSAWVQSHERTVREG